MPPASARLRGQALDWLRADLAGVRETAALDKVSPEERTARQKLWAEVAALRKKAEGRK